MIVEVFILKTAQAETNEIDLLKKNTPNECTRDINIRFVTCLHILACYVKLKFSLD